MFDREKCIGQKCAVSGEFRNGVWFDITCARCNGKNLFRVENRTQFCTHCGATLMRDVTFTAH